MNLFEKWILPVCSFKDNIIDEWHFVQRKFVYVSYTFTKTYNMPDSKMFTTLEIVTE